MECTVRNVKIYYETCGEGMPILMIHGWGPDHRLMKGCMEPIFGAMNTAWKRIYFDLPGMGKTKGQPWITGSDQMLDLVLGFIDAVIPNQRFVLAGESYGGHLARGIIAKRPSVVDGLLLICPLVMSSEIKKEPDARYKVLEKDETFLSSLSEEDRNFFMAEGVNASLNERVWLRYKEEVLPGLQLTDHSFTEVFWRNTAFSFDVDNPEKPFLKPALMLAGRQDSKVGFRRLWEIIGVYPRASFLLLDKAGHALQIEQDILFTAAVKEWLGRVAAETGLEQPA